LEDTAPSSFRLQPQQHLPCVGHASFEASQLLSHLEVEVEVEDRIVDENTNLKIIKLTLKVKFELRYKSVRLCWMFLLNT